MATDDERKDTADQKMISLLVVASCWVARRRAGYDLGVIERDLERVVLSFDRPDEPTEPNDELLLLRRLHRAANEQMSIRACASLEDALVDLLEAGYPPPEDLP